MALPTPSAPRSPTRTSLPARLRPLLSRVVSFLACWPAWVAVAMFLGFIGYEITEIKAQQGGRFVYVLDDSYGHLATAKNLLRHGVWSYNYANGFESGVSSLIWPLVIAVLFLFSGVHEWASLALNIAAMVAALFYMGGLLRRTTGSNVLSLLVLCFTVLFVPLHAVAVTGMEHSLQILVSLAFVHLAAALLMDDSGRLATPRTPRWLCVSGVLVVMTRYEGLFLIAAVGLLLICRGRWRLAITLGVVSVTPVVLFGLFALSKGWFFLPNSLMLKGNVRLTPTLAGLVEYFDKGYRLMLSEQHMPVLIAVAVVTLLATLQKRWNLWTYPALVMLITLITAVQHLQFASIGWFYRYEAYLIVLVFYGAGVALGYEGPPRGFRYWLRPAAIPHLAALALAVSFVAVPFWPRTRNAFPFIISASYSIYGQQYQMGRFVGRFYKNRGVIANDVCAISYFGDGIRLLDFAGLCSVDALRLRLKGGFNQDSMRRLSREPGSDIAILYEDWAKAIFDGPLPEWVRVGTWTIPRNTVAAGDTVAFYATSQDKAPELIRALQQFSSFLPGDVRQEGIYRGQESLSPWGVYFPPGGGEEARHYWAKETAQFNVYPAEEVPTGVADARLDLSVFTVNPNQSIEVYFNGELVQTKLVSAAETRNWVSFPSKVKWRSGPNVLKLVARGTPTIMPGGDPRPVLFAVLDPRRRRNEDGSMGAQPGVAQPRQ